ncbi:MAG: tetratricopeptide repeat protein [Planctomycetota bacterium]|nr:tetratricopeptide repeat protein [Planctomycetota bacterium]
MWRHRSQPVRAGVLCFIACLAFVQPQLPVEKVAEIPPAKEGLRPVRLPRLDRLEPGVAEQIKLVQHSFIELAARPDTPASELAEGYGMLGQLYHAYELFEPAESCYLNAGSLAPDDFRSRYLLGRIYRSTGDLANAEKYYKDVRRRRPDYAAAATNLGSVYLQLNRPQEARTQFDAALALAPGDAAARNGLGEVALAEQKYSDAARHFQAALDRAPGANRIHYSLAMAYRGMGDQDKVRHHLQQKGSVGVRPADPLFDNLAHLVQGERVFLIRGRLAFGAGRYQEASDAFAKAVEAKPDSVRARINLGVSLSKIGKVDQAVEQFRVALRHDPTNVNALFNLGTLLLGKGEHAQAALQFQAILSVDPADIEAIRELAKSLVALRRPNEAISQLYKAAAFEPENDSALLDLSNLLQQQERFKEARALLQRANRRDPSSGLTAHALARLLATCPDLSLRDGRRALDLARNVYKIRESPTFAETKALALAELGRCDEASAIQRQLVAKAEQLGNEQLEARLTKELLRYENGSPCRPPA